SAELKKYNIQKSFLATTGITETGELSITSQIESDIKKTTLETAEISYLLANSSKFVNSSLMRFGNIHDLNGILNDSIITIEIINQYRRMRLNVMIEQIS